MPSAADAGYNIRRLGRGRLARAMALTLSVVAFAGFPPGAAGGETAFAHREGRVAVNLPDNGAFAVIEAEGARLGLAWPGSDGSEFLGSGGFFLRFRRGEAATYEFAAPWDFKRIDVWNRMRVSEGCEGGKRYPHRSCDDDGDGAVDEDPLDGKDNDRDGKVDEDFAAIGDGMVVTRAAEPSSGLVLGQSSYAWNYGHVRDFVGFTTVLELPEEKRDRGIQIRNLEIALCTDFDIGAPDNEQRGSDDRFFFFIGPDSPGGDALPFELAAAADGSSAARYVGVLVLEVAGPTDSPLDVDPFIVKEFDRPDSLWNMLASAEGNGPIRPGRRRGAAGWEAPFGGKQPRVSGVVDGEMTIVHRIGQVKQLKPGGRVRIDWALVFAASAEALIKNVGRALETYRGITDEEGKSYRWVVPARRAVRRELGMTLASVFTDSRRQPAAGIEVPVDLEMEEVEWIRINGNVTTRYERVGATVVIPLERELIDRGESFTVEGQLTDGTIFTAKPSGEFLQAFGMSEELPPGRLPEDCMHVFPNPFLTALTIDVNLPGPGVYANSTSRDVEAASSVRMYDVKGRLVRTILEEEFLHPGSYQLGWDGLDESGGKAAPGVYYCKLQIGDRSLTKRVILLR